MVNRKRDTPTHLINTTTNLSPLKQYTLFPYRSIHTFTLYHLAVIQWIAAPNLPHPDLFFPMASFGIAA